MSLSSQRLSKGTRAALRRLPLERRDPRTRVRRSQLVVGIVTRRRRRMNRDRGDGGPEEAAGEGAPVCSEPANRCRFPLLRAAAQLIVRTNTLRQTLGIDHDDAQEHLDTPLPVRRRLQRVHPTPRRPRHPHRLREWRCCRCARQYRRQDGGLGPLHSPPSRPVLRCPTPC